MDNTLYNWMDSYAPGLDAQITYIAKNTSNTKDRIRASFKRVFQEHGSVELIDAVSELDIWQESVLTDAEILLIQTQSTEAFLTAFNSNLQLYPNVYETLEWAKANNLLVFGFSDAYAFWVDYRLQQLGIESFFEKIYALEDKPNWHSDITLSERIIALPEKQLKPNTFVLDQIALDYNILKKNIYMVGDSKYKDVRTAMLAGTNNIWAQYGTCYSKKSRNLLSSITPWTRSQKMGGYRIVPQHTITDFGQIKDIIMKEW